MKDRRLAALVFCLGASFGACRGSGYERTELTCEQADACARSSAEGGAAGGAGGTAAGDECSNVPCLQRAESLMAACVAVGPCVSQQVSFMPSTLTNDCFDNGVKVFETMEASGEGASFTLTSTYQVKKGEAPCYTRTFVTHGPPDAGASNAVAITTKDGAGATVAIVNVDEAGTPTVTCPGGQPTVPAYPCGYSSIVRTAIAAQQPAPICTSGVCVF